MERHICTEAILVAPFTFSGPAIGLWFFLFAAGAEILSMVEVSYPSHKSD
jgi:hypothetical protein